MRLKIDLGTSSLPIAYNTLFMSAIKEAIKASDLEYYEKLYYFEGKNNKVTKNLTFSVSINDYIIEQDKFKINGHVSLFISTPDYELGLMIYNGMIKKKIFSYKEFEWTRLRVNLLKERSILGGEITFKTLSPICIKNTEGRFIGPDEGKIYQNELNYITNQILINYRGVGLKKTLVFTPISLKKVVVKESLREFKEKTGRDYQCVNAYRGLFSLQGDQEDLNAIYQLGIGFKRAQGFGNLDVLE